MSRASKAAPWIATVLTVIVWDLCVRLFHIAPYLVPAPLSVLNEMWVRRMDLLNASIWTSLEIWCGFALAVLMGLVLGIQIAYSRALEASVLPLLVVLQVIPKVAVAPLFLMWLGYGLSPKILVACLIAFFPVLINTIKGLRTVDHELTQWISTLGASPLQLFSKLALPWSLPYVFASMKVAITFAVVGAIVGEFVGSDRGLGYLILTSSNLLDTKLTFAALTVLSIIGMVSYWIVLVAERLLVPWERAAEEPVATA
jgi:NitT/TauT family transport system permease protein